VIAESPDPRVTDRGYISVRFHCLAMSAVSQSIGGAAKALGPLY
jgi:hypothetical protein